MNDFFSYYFFLSFFFFFRAAGTAYGSSQARDWLGATAAGLHHSNARSELRLAVYTTAHGNAGSLTHWVRPGIEPASSWILVRFVSTEPWWELPLPLFFMFQFCQTICRSLSMSCQLAFLPIWMSSPSPHPFVLSSYHLFFKSQLRCRLHYHGFVNAMLQTHTDINTLESKFHVSYFSVTGLLSARPWHIIGN